MVRGGPNCSKTITNKKTVSGVYSRSDAGNEVANLHILNKEEKSIGHQRHRPLKENKHESQKLKEKFSKPFSPKRSSQLKRILRSIDQELQSETSTQRYRQVTEFEVKEDERDELVSRSREDGRLKILLRLIRLFCKGTHINLLFA